MSEITIPRTIVTGEDALEYLKEIKGKRALIVTDKVISKLNFVEKVSNYLKEAGLEVKIFDEVEPEPTIETVMKGAEFATEYGPDLFVGLGGGSCMDAAKAIWVLYAKPDQELKEISPFIELGLRKKARLVNIPTTSGTGADATWAAIITDKKEVRKLELPSRELVADISILDPSLPMLMPKRLTADTGLDALVHAMDGYISQSSNDFSDAMAIKAIQLVFRYLPRAYEDGKDMEAREKMHNAGTMGGLAFGNAHCGIAHSMGHSLGAIFKIPHGRAVGVFLPYVIEYMSNEAKDRFAEIAKAVDIRAESEDEAVRKLLASIRDLMKKIGEPLSVKEMGISWEDYQKKLEELVTKAEQDACTIFNPRTPTIEEFRKLFIYAYEGKRVDF